MPEAGIWNPTFARCLPADEISPNRVLSEEHPSIHKERMSTNEIVTARKVAFVTGGSRGIGKATAEMLAQRGALVAVNYLENHESAFAVRDSLIGSGHLAIQADVSDSSSIRDAIDRVVDDCGRIDILVNNAGVFEVDDVLTLTYEQWQEIWQRSIGINLLGAVNASFCAVQHMRASGTGCIVNVGSRGAYRGDPDNLGYVAAKAGLKAMAQSLAIKVAKDGIFVGTVAPGIVDTDMTAPFVEGPLREQVEQQNPTGRIATADEVANAITYLAIDAPRSMTGAVLDINGASWIRP